MKIEADHVVTLLRSNELHARRAGIAGIAFLAIEDEELISRIRKRDRDAFAVIFQRHYAELCSFATTYVNSFDDAREAVQVVFVRLWEKCESWDVDSSVRGYLFAAVRNQCLNLLRGQRRLRQVALPTARNARESINDRTPEDEFCYYEDVLVIQNAIDNLPERQRAAFLFHRRHGLTYKEIASMMGISVRTVEAHIARALKALYLALPDD